MHGLKNIIFSFSFLLAGLFCDTYTLMAQSFNVQLDEVQIRGSAKSSHTSGLHTIRIDTLLKSKYFGSDLAHILKQETNLNITQYGGQGSLASIRIRGSAPSQTQINWNGIPVNGPTTGTIDLSLLTGGMADEIEIAYGASGSLFGNGTFGGSINLFNKPDWNNRLSLNLGAETGSWKHIKTGLNFRAGNDFFQYHLTGLYQNSPNTYSYHNTFKQGNPVEYRQNDSMNLMAVQQHIFFKLPHSWYIQYGGWWDSRIKQLPAPMASTPVNTAIQKDQSTRQFVRITKWYRKSSMEAVAAHFTDSLLYTEKSSGSNTLLKQSGIRSSITFLSFYHRWFISNKLTLENGADFEYQSARVPSYKGLAGEFRGALFTLFKYEDKRFSSNLSYRQVFYSMTGPKPLLSAAFQYHLQSAGFSVKAQVSNKYRFPTLNDRYWQPGGNPALLPETGMGYDLGLIWDLAGSSRSDIKLSSLFFLQQINNWIQWVPTGTYWSPQNIKQVNCKGIEVDITGRWMIGSFGLIAKTMYTYTESFDMSLPASESRYQRQLAYVPFHLFNIRAGFNYHRIETSFGYKYTSRRFTTDDHDPWLDLDPFHLADFSISYSILTKRDKIIVTGNIANLLDTSYQLIRAYPAPGRSFYLSVNYKFNQKPKEND